MTTPARNIPFKNLNADARRNLALVAACLLYIFTFIAVILHPGVLLGAGSDFLALWSAGKAAILYGYSQIYNLEVLQQIQFLPLQDVFASPQDFYPIPVPYFPVFILPFQLFSLLDARTGFWVYSVFSAVVLAGYLLFFLRRLLPGRKLDSGQKVLAAALMVSYPVLSNLLFGQVEIFLFICAGEMIRAAQAKKSQLCGAWMGGLLLKPQLLLLVIPALLLMRHWKLLAGFVLVSTLVLLSSLALSGPEGLADMIGLWTSYVPGVASNSPHAMANWRMLAVNFNTWTNSWFGWIPAVLGILATLYIWIRLSLVRAAFGSPRWILNLAAVMAASGAVTWHSHIHMCMALIPFLLYAVFFFPGDAVRKAVDWFSFSYPAALLLGYLYLLTAVIWKFQPVANLNNFLLGLAGLCVYLNILATMPKVHPEHDSLQFQQQTLTPSNDRSQIQ